MYSCSFLVLHTRNEVGRLAYPLHEMVYRLANVKRLHRNYPQVRFGNLNSDLHSAKIQVSLKAQIKPHIWNLTHDLYLKLNVDYIAQGT